MRLLVLGGTEFVGRAVTHAALTRDWHVTVFHRGHHPAPAAAHTRHGDRTTSGGLSALEHGTWDIVVDTWSAAPAAVRATAHLLAGRADSYVYVSSGSVYTYPRPAGATENAPVVTATPDDGPDVDYARAKRGGELAAQAAFGDRALLARAGLILGPWENIGRLPWWLHRTARGGPILAPGPADLPLQYIDVRDLADWLLDAAVHRLGGPYNTVSAPGHTTMGELLHTCAKVTGGTADLRWTDPDTILAAGIQPWIELPIWLPPGEPHDAMHRVDVTKATAAGLRCRPVTDTVADTWAWLQQLDGAAPQRPDRPTVGLDPDTEAALLHP